MNTSAFQGGGPGPWILFVPLVWAAVLATVFTIVRHARRGRWSVGPVGPRQTMGARGGYDERSPIAIVGRRFAAGEIDEDEYWRRVSVLDEQFGRPGGRSAAL
ncbi:SHOCT domain-containing protein [Streptomyces sp. NBC_01497]|uniref:SHOCT domain-containing protein n=1 Tax=Streptomyces sp. NBC_01497 TaxID=2903885 RepID=UPI002E33C0FB|nr:SHOCT domain-containing protein [Streptomyces sp. NBC_01497]